MLRGEIYAGVGGLEDKKLFVLKEIATRVSTRSVKEIDKTQVTLWERK